MLLKIQSAILCDLVRPEGSGKHILIGVYTGDVLFSGFPAKFAHTYWIEFKPLAKTDEVDFELKMDIPGAKKPRISPGKMKMEQGKPGVLVVTVPLLEIAKPGILRLSIRLKGGRWIQVISKNLGLVESSLPSA